jgi:hypothetical protein
MLFQAFANVETLANGGFDEGGDVIASVKTFQLFSSIYTQ